MQYYKYQGRNIPIVDYDDKVCVPFEIDDKIIYKPLEIVIWEMAHKRLVPSGYRVELVDMKDIYVPDNFMLVKI